MIQLKCDFSVQSQFILWCKEPQKQSQITICTECRSAESPAFPIYSICRHQTRFHRLHQYFNEFPSMFSLCTLMVSMLSAWFSLHFVWDFYICTERHLTLKYTVTTEECRQTVSVKSSLIFLLQCDFILHLYALYHSVRSANGADKMIPKQEPWLARGALWHRAWDHSLSMWNYQKLPVTSRLRNSFFPHAIRLMNSKN